MQGIFSKWSVVSIAMLTATSSALAARSISVSASDPQARIIMGSDNAKHFKSPSNGHFYFQSATFKHKKNAEHYQEVLARRVPYPVMVEKRSHYFIVLTGPIHTAAEVNAMGRAVANGTSIKKRPVEPLSTHHDKSNDRVDVGDKDATIASNTTANHYEIMGALGVGSLMPGSGMLGVTSNEIDRLVKPNGNNWDAFAAQAGVGYVHYLHGALQYSEKLQWFPSVEPELNGYYLGQQHFTGDIWRFNNPNFNEMTYNTSVQSTRLMVDGALTIAAKKQFSLYAKGGIGNAWNQLKYSDTDSANAALCADQGLNLGSHTISNFAWEAGAGINYAFNPRVMISLEYLYADLGQMKTSASGNTGSITTPSLVPASFDLNSQAALLGLHITL